MARVVGREMRPPLGAVIGALAGITQGGSYLMFYYLFAFPWGAILGGIYGLVVGLVDALLVAAVTRALYLPLSEPAKHRRAVVMASVLGVLIVPGYWFVSLLRSSGYEGFSVSGSVTGLTPSSTLASHYCCSHSSLSGSAVTWRAGTSVRLPEHRLVVRRSRYSQGRCVTAALSAGHSSGYSQ